MTESDRWVRRTSAKRPITVTGRPASSTDAGTWSAYKDAAASTRGAGLGFVTGDGVGCIDLDHCLAGGVLAEWARQIVDACEGTFVEVSQSGTGLHIFGLLPGGAGRRIRRGEVAVEVYSGAQYIAVTGDRFEGAPSALADLSEVVASII